MEVYVYVSMGVGMCKRVRQFLMKMVLLIVEKIYSVSLPHFPLSPKHTTLRNLSLKAPAMPAWYFSGSCSLQLPGKGPE